MSPLDLVKLTGLMEVTRGRPEMRVGLIGGPVACLHGTFVAGILSAKRDSPAPAICPDCTLLVRRIFSETIRANTDMPRAPPDHLGAAVINAVQAAARVINLSGAVGATACLLSMVPRWTTHV